LNLWHLSRRQFVLREIYRSKIYVLSLFESTRYTSIKYVWYPITVVFYNCNDTRRVSTHKWDKHTTYSLIKFVIFSNKTNTYSFVLKHIILFHCWLTSVLNSFLVSKNPLPFILFTVRRWGEQTDYQTENTYSFRRWCAYRTSVCTSNWECLCRE